MEKFVGKRVLVTIGDNDSIRQTVIVSLSPNKKYCYLNGSRTTDEFIGWVKCSDINVKDSWQDNNVNPQINS